MADRVARFTFGCNPTITMMTPPVLPAEVRRLSERRKAVSDIYPAMFRVLSILFQHDLSRAKLLQFLDLVATQKGVIVDRTAKRSRDGMVCWLCETAPELAKPLDPSKKPFDISSIGFDDELRKEEELLLLTLS
jgi:hypothetical protein